MPFTLTEDPSDADEGSGHAAINGEEVDFMPANPFPKSPSGPLMNEQQTTTFRPR
jgi:hypothetical protein